MSLRRYSKGRDECPLCDCSDLETEAGFTEDGVAWDLALCYACEHKWYQPLVLDD